MEKCIVQTFLFAVTTVKWLLIWFRCCTHDVFYQCKLVKPEHLNLHLHLDFHQEIPNGRDSP